MKTLWITLMLILSGTLMSLAQCDKKSTFISSHTIYLAPGGTVERSVDENVQIDMGKSDIVIMHGADNEKMTGKLKQISCDWKTPFKEGKTTLAAVLQDEHGDQKNVTIIIEGKEGKVTFTLEVEGMEGRKIQVTADKFEESA